MRKRRGEYLFAPPKKRGGARGVVLMAMFLVLAAVAAVALINHASNTRVSLENESVAVMGLDKAFTGFTVLHLSDLHAAALGSNAELWEDLLYGKAVNAVVMTGDMVGSGGDYGPLVALIRTLRGVNAQAPIYFIAGDDDPEPVLSTAHGSAEVLADWVLAAQAAGAVYLDAPMSQAAGARKVWFSPEALYGVDAANMVSSLTAQKAQMEAQGAQYEGDAGASYRALCYRLDVMERTVAAQAEMATTDLQIAVAHAPLEAGYIRTSLEWAAGDTDAAFNFRAITLLLAGHYCGGQWRLPDGRILYVPEYGWFPDEAGLVGMQRVNSINQYVSRGLGASEAYPMGGRLFNPPGATLLRFTASIQ